MTGYIILAIVLFGGACIGKSKYDAIYATRNELRKQRRRR